MASTLQTTLKWTRTVHVYLTLAAMVLLLFFATTGFLMNHESWFKGTARTVEETATIPADILAGDRLTLVEYLRAHLGAVGEAKFSDKTEKSTDPKAALAINFRKPGVTTDFVIKKTGETKITRSHRGLFGLVTDMHRGKQSTAAWRILTDLTALSLAAAIVTGFILWLSLKKRRTLGIIGLALCVTVAGTLFLLAAS